MGEKREISRRTFLKTTLSTGAASLLVPAGSVLAGDKTRKAALPQVPRRALGKTGVTVPILCLGGYFDILHKQSVLHKALEWGVTYWDTADSYLNGNSEKGIGSYLKTNPTIRAKLFLASKCKEGSEAWMQQKLEQSLDRLKTDYIDLFFIHMMSDPAVLTDAVKRWAEKNKRSGKIKLFGFSTHENMTQCLKRAADLGWVDAVMTSYNFRLMPDAQMQAAVEACHKAGIGIVAMKAQAVGQKPDGADDGKLTAHFMQRGFTKHQARLKAVWQDERIASICSQMPNDALLISNVAAALDRTTLSKADRECLNGFAQATCNQYCSGCTEICAAALPQMPYVSTVMRSVMYDINYGEFDRARELFTGIPGDVRSRIAYIDFTEAEARCPNHLPVGSIMAEAVKRFS